MERRVLIEGPYSGRNASGQYVPYWRVSIGEGDGQNNSRVFTSREQAREAARQQAGHLGILAIDQSEGIEQWEIREARLRAVLARQDKEA
jgi:hypothetical protein